MSSWLNNDHTYETSIEDFPSRIKYVPIMEYNKIQRLIDVDVKQIRFFKGQPEMGWPHHYAVNGEAIINGEKKLVSCLCTDTAFVQYKTNPGLMVFELMAGEIIPERWGK